MSIFYKYHKYSISYFIVILFIILSAPLVQRLWSNKYNLPISHHLFYYDAKKVGKPSIIESKLFLSSLAIINNLTIVKYPIEV